MVPYKNGLTIPSINTDICVGCGGCESICPAKPYRAIYVEGNPVHLQAKHFKETKTKKVDLDSFGF
jgi:ferredoxin